MMSINTILIITILTIPTRHRARKILQGREIILGGFIVVFKGAIVAFAAGTAEIVVVAEFVGLSALFDFGEGFFVDV